MSSCVHTASSSYLKVQCIFYFCLFFFCLALLFFMNQCFLSFIHGSFHICPVCQRVFVCVCICDSFVCLCPFHRALGFLKLCPAKRAWSPSSSSILQETKERKNSKLNKTFLIRNVLQQRLVCGVEDLLILVFKFLDQILCFLTCCWRKTQSSEVRWPQ